jgi:tRNA uridine 5-carbamoylmethylation protein Kti12
MQKQLNLILNGKGGVGKSFFATNFVQFLKDQKMPHVAIDTDNENSTLKRFHPDAQFVNLSQTREIDELFGALEGNAVVVVDCRAASTDLFLQYFAELKIFDVLEGMGAALTVVSPVNHDLDSVEQVRIIAKAFNDRCRYLVVKNHALTEHFAIYDASKTRKRLLSELVAKEMTMPKLHDWLVASLHQVNLPVGQAIQHQKFSLMDRQRLKNWQRLFHEQVNTVRDIILPGDA